MKKTILFTATSLMMLSTVSFAGQGLMPTCTSGKLNLAVVNVNLPDCRLEYMKGNSYGYCVYYAGYNVNVYLKGSCVDFSKYRMLFAGYNESVSFNRSLDYAAMDYEVGFEHSDGSDQRITHLWFTYSNGMVTNNCAQAFGNEINCTMSEVYVGDYPTYILTIQRK